MTVGVISGVSSTTTLSVSRSASIWRWISRRTAGCMIEFSAATDSSSLKAIAARPARSSEPSSRMIDAPKRAASSSSSGAPGTCS